MPIEAVVPEVLRGLLGSLREVEEVKVGLHH
jgi:hypothetical protein